MSNLILEMVHRQNEISQMLKNPSRMYDELMATNPAFKDFVERNKNKSIGQIAAEYNIDQDLLRKYIK